MSVQRDLRGPLGSSELSLKTTAIEARPENSGNGILFEPGNCIAFINLIKKDSTGNWQKRDLAGHEHFYSLS